MTRDQAIDVIAPIVLDHAHNLIASDLADDARTLIAAWLLVTNPPNER